MLELELVDVVFTSVLLSGKPAVLVSNDVAPDLGACVTIAEVCTIDPKLPRSGRRVRGVVSRVGSHEVGWELLLSELGAA